MDLSENLDVSESLFPQDESTPAIGDTPLPGSDALSERDVQILSFERQWWRHAGSKEQAIRDRFGISPTRYYQLLNALIDSPDAMSYDPMLVKRLRRLRASRARARALRRPDMDHPSRADS